MHWLGPYIVKEIMDGSVVQLAKLNSELFLGKINGNRLKLYRVILPLCNEYMMVG